MYIFRKSFVGALSLSVLASISSCKKEDQKPGADELVIRLPPGLVHIGAQWVDGKVWVESYDPITNACLLRLYDADGKAVEGSTKVRLKGCHIDMSTPPPAQ